MDIPLLVANFIKEFAIRNGKVITGINDEAMEYLLKYDWPGNVRELRTTIEHAVVFCKGDTITARDLPLFIRQPNRTEIKTDSNVSIKSEINVPDSPLTIKEAEKKLIINALNECDGNRTLAAKRIGISRRTLHRKLKEYDIKDI
jgi:DNA-binding NtrC family response regulator